MSDPTRTPPKSRSRRKPAGASAPRRRRGFFGSVFAFLVGVVATYYGFCTLCLLAYNIVPPPTTGVQLQRLVESFFEDKPYEHHYRPVGAGRISPHLRHAAVAAEDQRFYDHGGVDWEAIQKAYEDNRRRGRLWRGGSTITQQLVKNLFMTTHSSFVRKAFEVPLAYIAEWVLPKERILTLYLNVIEFGRGVYGAEAASRHYYDKPAAKLTRRQAASLAAVIPAPRRRVPQRMGWYTNEIQRRMRNHGW